ncbi:MAG: glycogen/starch/alpha-glucan phosphorylase [Victivallales bacterium]|nr:glycogen/starch/alpha-glucan phosphorylase [Victivallales bacterium]
MTTDKKFEKEIADFKKDYYDNLRYTLGLSEKSLTELVNYHALSLAVRDRIMDRWIDTQNAFQETNPREIYYLSLEFLIGRLLSNNVINLGLEPVVRKALEGTGYTWEQTCQFEVDAGLGNGGLGRLAACFLDSMSTMNVPNIGYGLRYDYGIFKQKIVNGAQVEEPDDWLRNGYPWEFRRPEYVVYAQFGGKVDYYDHEGVQKWVWIPDERVKGIPFDIPVVGYNGTTVNTLRLWSAFSDNEFNLDEFNNGSYTEAVENKVLAENLTKVLYPNDNVDQGKELRLRQQYFFVACTVRDIFRRHLKRCNTLAQLPEKVFIQLNDTHPTLLIPEIMRVLIDEMEMGWDDAWRITSSCVGYTNHTVLPEALETWGLKLFEKLLPRHLQIIYEINARFLKEVSYRHPGDNQRFRRMSVIDETKGKKVRMAHLALIGASKVNGVAEIHSSILKNEIFKDFADLWPEKFTNVTNGITQRRWLLNANPKLSSLITSRIGDKWITDLYELRKLEQFVNDDEFLKEFSSIKRENKQHLSAYIKNTLGITVDPDSIFDVQIKRLHEYKRQFLLALYIIMLYDRLVDNPHLEIVPRTFIFSGKAAPGYAMAKLIIRLIHEIAEAVNKNPLVNKKLHVAFLPDYRVSLAELIIPAADVSEQISLAGTEASGTGCMKLMLNGAMTLGTMDGANVEIRQEVGPENIFIFGMNADEVTAKRPTYSPIDIYYADSEIRRVVDSLANDTFNILTPGLFRPLADSLIKYGDRYMQLADLRSYADAQERINALYLDKRAWAQKTLMNVARSGKFSSDRTIREYCEKIWNITPGR